MSESNEYEPRMTNWDVVWNAFGLGLVGNVDPALKLMLEPITRGTTGKIILGHYIIGLEGSVKVEVQDVTLQAMQKLCPWWNGTGQMPLVPGTPNTNLADYGELLTLHPHDVAADDVTQDLNLIKAVPMQPGSAIKRDGIKGDVYPVEFVFYPDLAKLQSAPPQLFYGCVGAVPE